MGRHAPLHHLLHGQDHQYLVLLFDHLSRVMRKPMFCICKDKDADQLRGNREADQCLCFRYICSMIPLLSKTEISSLQPSSVAVQPGLCRTRSETRMLVFSCRGSSQGCGLKPGSGHTQDKTLSALVFFSVISSFHPI